MLPAMFLACMPLLMGVGVILGLERLQRTRYRVHGISPSYFASVALLFGLFASLAATDAWQRMNKTSLALATEVSELRALLRIAETQPQEGPQIRRAVGDYVIQLRARELTEVNLSSAMAEPPASLHQLYAIGARPGAFQGNSSVNASYLASLEAIRASRIQRLELGHSRIPLRHFMTLLLMGFLTQIAIGFSHCGNRVACAYSVMLFSVAFGAALHFIQAFDDPHSGGYEAGMAKLAEVR